MTNLNEQLEAEKNFSEAIVANIREPLLVLDKSLRVRKANKAFYKLFNLKEEETEGVVIYDLGNDQWEIPKLRILLEKTIPKESVINDFKVKHTFPGIGELIMLLNAREVTTKNSSEKLILLSMEDITRQVIERRKRREIQRQYTRELEEKIHEHTIELKSTSEELQQKNEELVKINKELEAFAYVSSHDLQAPLRKIQTIAGRILEIESQNLSDKGKTYFNFMRNAAWKMQKLVEDLLSFSSLTISERKFEKIDLNNLIDEVIANFEEKLKEKNATIDVSECCEADIIVFQFHQLLQNLISNALKFSKTGVPPFINIKSRIKKGRDLTAEDFSPDEEYCHISVMDNGIGFEKKYCEKIFEVFQKLHAKDEFPGTGIGLAIVQKVVDNHNGVITVSSEPNKGTVFDIYIPVRNR